MEGTVFLKTNWNLSLPYSIDTKYFLLLGIKISLSTILVYPTVILQL